ncbi:MAG TPA: GNAT family N-acetyltransferase [Chloroflexia bacterium]|nr:GNAT family N-acetyltransferase [Chloroflexia bacterium]
MPRSEPREPLLGEEPGEDMLVAAMEANTQAAFLAWAGLIGAAIHDDPDRLWYMSGLPLGVGNSVLRASFTSSDPHAEIAAALAPFRARSLAVAWFVGPGSRPADLPQRLAGYGFRPDAQPGLVADLIDLPAPAPLPRGFTVERVADAAGMADWTATLLRTDVFPAQAARILADVQAEHPFQLHSAVHFYLGRQDGAPVSTALLFLAAGVAGLYCVGTVPEQRGAGRGTAVTVAALEGARAAGYRWAGLQSSPMGLPIYERLGFRQVCRFHLLFSF